MSLILAALSAAMTLFVAVVLSAGGKFMGRPTGAARTLVGGLSFAALVAATHWIGW